MKINTIESLEAIEKAQDGNDRLVSLKKHSSDELKTYLRFALSPQITLGIKKFKDLHSNDSCLGDQWFGELIALLGGLQDRKITGNKSKEAVECFLARCSELESKWSQRVIKQDLKLNIGVKEVNKALGPGTIFQFSVPLAEDFNKIDSSKIIGLWVAQPKLDGARCVAYLPANNGEVKLFSRTGKEYRNFKSIKQSLQNLNSIRDPDISIVLDGEVVSYVDGKIDFQSIQSTLFRKDGVEYGQLNFVVFDGCSQQEWESPSHTYLSRHIFVSNLIEKHCGGIKNIKMIESEVTTDISRDNVMRICDEFVSKGFEGCILRNTEAKVALKRTKNLIKVKRFCDEEAEIIGFVQGQGKYESTLGALKCRSKSGVEFEIGSGFTDDQRRDIWATIAATHHPVVVYKYQELTKDGVPRFPVFKGFRHEDDIES